MTSKSGCYKARCAFICNLGNGSTQTQLKFKFSCLLDCQPLPYDLDHLPHGLPGHVPVEPDHAEGEDVAGVADDDGVGGVVPRRRGAGGGGAPVAARGGGCGVVAERVVLVHVQGVAGGLHPT